MFTVKVGEAKIQHALSVGSEADRRARTLEFRDPYALVTLGTQEIKTFVIEGEPAAPNWGQLLELEAPKKTSEVKVAVFNRADRSCQYMADQLIGEAYIVVDQIPFGLEAPWPLRKRRNGLITGYVSLTFSCPSLEEEQKKKLDKIESKTKPPPTNSSAPVFQPQTSLKDVKEYKEPKELTISDEGIKGGTIRGKKLGKVRATFTIKKKTGKKDDTKDRIKAFIDALQSQESTSQNEDEYDDLFQSIELDFSWLSLSEIPAELWEEFERSPQTLNNINLNYNALTSIKPLFFHLKMKKIQLTSNPLKTLPPEIGSFIWSETLSYLTLSHCQLESVHPNIGFLKNLDHLDLSHNSLSLLADEIGCLSKLKVLLVNNNENLKQLPATLCCCSNLLQLNASHCGLISLPDSLCANVVLVEMVVSNNQIYKLPNNIGKLINLTILNIADNQLTDVPLSMAHCKGLKIIDFSSNPISDRSLASTISAGAPSFLNFLSTRTTSKVKQGVMLYTQDTKAINVPKLGEQPDLPPLVIPPKQASSSDPKKIKSKTISSPPVYSGVAPSTSPKIEGLHLNGLDGKGNKDATVALRSPTASSTTAGIQEIRLSRCFKEEELEDEMELNANDLERLNSICTHLRREADEMNQKFAAYKAELMGSLAIVRPSPQVVERSKVLHATLKKVITFLEPFEARGGSSSNFDYDLKNAPDPTSQNGVIVRSAAILIDSLQRRFISLQSVINKDKPSMLAVSKAIVALREIKAALEKEGDGEIKDNIPVTRQSRSGSVSAHPTSGSLTGSLGSKASNSPTISSVSASRRQVSDEDRMTSSTQNSLSSTTGTSSAKPVKTSTSSTSPSSSPSSSSPASPASSSSPSSSYILRSESPRTPPARRPRASTTTTSPSQSSDSLPSPKSVREEETTTSTATITTEAQLDPETREKLIRLKTAGIDLIRILVTKLSHLEETVFITPSFTDCMVQGKLMMTTKPEIQELKSSLVDFSVKSAPVTIAPLDNSAESQKLANLQVTIIGVIRDLQNVLTEHEKSLNMEWEVKKIVSILQALKTLRSKLLVS